MLFTNKKAASAAFLLQPLESRWRRGADELTLFLTFIAKAMWLTGFKVIRIPSF
jgi:hypothetical protein